MFDSTQEFTFFQKSESLTVWSKETLRKEQDELIICDNVPEYFLSSVIKNGITN